MRTILFSLTLLFLVDKCVAGDLAVELIAAKSDFIQGEPVRVAATIRNTSGKPLVIALGGTAGYKTYLDIRRTDGQLIQQDCDRPTVETTPSYTTKELPADWQETQLNRLCIGQPGEYLVKFIVESPGPYIQRDASGRVLGEVSAWTGHIESQQIAIRLLVPIGIDQLAYEEFKPNPLAHAPELLKKYPASTYAAWALWEQGEAAYTGFKEMGADKDFQLDKLLEKDYQDCPGCVESYRMEIRSVTKPWEELYRNFPEFAFRAKLLYGLSRAYFWSGTHGKAIPLLKELEQRFAGTEQAKKAQVYKQALVEHQMWKD